MQTVYFDTHNVLAVSLINLFYDMIFSYPLWFALLVLSLIWFSCLETKAAGSK
uniref:Uncharacterized protein n=1 Tax=Anguilla anguilla TaxID=7936 RepID=A0A0E9XI75_ANGAN